jgi:hypothetical protein
VLETPLPNGLDCIRAAAETNYSAVTVKLFDWQVTLLKLALGQPIVDATEEKNDDAQNADIEATVDVTES